MRRRSRWAALCAAVSAALLATMVVAPSAAAAPAPDRARAATSTYQYYLSLGDSLGFGYSDANLASFEENHKLSDFAGYTQILAADPHVTGSTTNLSCPGESTSTMLGLGGKFCPVEVGGYGTWPYSGSQMTAATTFLQSHRWERGLITLSIGADDVLPTARLCLSNPSCPDLAPALKTMRANLATILDKLRRAAPFATIVVLAPYNPFGKAFPESKIPAVAFDLSIAAVALTHFDPVADAFVPINVKNANDFDCGNLIYYCADQTPSTADGYPSDIHPTSGGYTVIAQAFEKALR